MSIEDRFRAAGQLVTVTIPTGLLLSGIRHDLESYADQHRPLAVIREYWPVLAPFRAAILMWLDTARFRKWHARTPFEEAMAWIESQPD